MQSNLKLEQLLTDTFLKNIYQEGQKIKAYLTVAHKNIFSQLGKTFFSTDIVLAEQQPLEILQELQKKFDDLINEDWQDADEGVYPMNLLFEDNWLEFCSTYFNFWLDAPATWQRMKKQKYQEFPANINLEKYPQYYRRNFHYQTDGYLSDNSANLYDLQVDILFNGAADSMRRRILKPLKTGLKKLEVSTNAKRILDVACGTGRTLKFLRNTFPTASLYGLDLSSAYLRKANQLLSQIPGELPQLVEGNGEHLPYADNYFQGVSNVFLLHELPNPVRQKVINEFFRVLQPGGVLVIADSIQESDSHDLKSILSKFALSFHEPFYNDYIKDDISLRLDKAGFIDIEEKIYSVSKYWIAKKP